MKEIEQDIFTDYVIKKKDKSDLVNSLSYLGVPQSELFLTLLNREIDARDKDGVDVVIMVAETLGVTADALPPLRSIALEKWHQEQEEIAKILGDFHLSEDVPLLMQMAFAKFEHIEIEGYDSLLLKCMRALGKFDCQQALDGLIVISKVDNVDVAEEIQWHMDQVRRRMASNAQLSG